MCAESGRALCGSDMSVIGKKLNPIQSSGANNVGHGDDNNQSPTNDQAPPAIVTPDDVLQMKNIADEYFCRPGELQRYFSFHFFLILTYEHNENWKLIEKDTSKVINPTIIV